jgi:regulatory protein
VDSSDINQSRAFHRALRFLEPRARSIKEVKDRLFKYGYGEQTVTAVVSELKGLGYLDDNEFAEMWVEDRITRGYGRNRIRDELIAKGIDSALVEAELSQIHEPGEDYSRALLLAEKQAEKYGQLDERVAQRRLFQFLVRRGYSFEVAGCVCMEIYGSNQS